MGRLCLGMIVFKIIFLNVALGNKYTAFIDVTLLSRQHK